MIDIRKKLIDQMIPINYENTIVKKIGTNSDIQKILLDQCNRAVEIAAPIAKYFKGKNDLESLKKIHSFIRKNLGYRRDPKKKQQIKLPNRFLLESGDCKSNSLFIYAICKNLGIPVDFKFANYSKLNGKIPSHVYNIAFNRNNSKFVCIDGTSSKFNFEKKPNYSKLANLMQIETLSDNIDFTISGKKAAARKEKRAEKKAAGKTKPQVIKKAIKKVAAKTGQNISKVKKAAVKVTKKAGQKVATAVGATPRTAFLALVALNVRGIANKLQAANQAELKAKWNKLGGNFTSLTNTIKKGSAKKPLLGIRNDIGSVAATVGATVTAAAPVLLALEKFIGKIDQVQDSATVKKGKQILAKNPKLKKVLAKKSDQAKKEIFKKVAAKTGQSPEDVKEFFDQAKDTFKEEQLAPPQTEKEAPSDNSKLLKYGLFGLGALGLGYLATRN